MEFLRLVKRRRSWINEIAYILLNVGLSISLFLTVKMTGFLWPALILVLISKWRIFAVRPRFWFANIQANMISIIVSVSYVIFLYVTESLSTTESNIAIVQAVLVVLDIIWLLFIKPRSKRKFIVLQAGIGIFLGVTSLFMFSYNWDVSLVVMSMWLIGYSSARHVLNSYDNEPHVVFLSLVWSLVIAEWGWLSYHWAVGYKLPYLGSLMLPQAAITTLAISFLYYKAYDSYYHHKKIRLNDVLFPMIFAIGIVAVLLLAFNSVIPAAQV